MTNRPPQDEIKEPWKTPDGEAATAPADLGPHGQIWRQPGDPKPNLGVIKGDKDKTGPVKK